MKRTLFCGVAIAACFGLATTASAQYESNFQYSSYGYRTQEEAQDAAADSVVDPPVAGDENTSAALEDAAEEDSAAQNTASCDGYYSSPVTGCDGGAVYGDAGACGCGAGGACGCGGGSILGGGCGALGGGCGAGGGGVGAGLVNNNTRNLTFALRGLVFDRDYEDDISLGYNPFNEYLFSTDVGESTIGGFETVLSSRNCNGMGWEIGYWGLFPGRDDVTFSGPPTATVIPGLDDLDLIGSPLDATLASADTWRIYRFNEIHNLEFNLLRNAGTTCGILGGTVNVEWLAGFRWFKFSEDFRWAGFSTTGPFAPETFYDLDVENNLLGAQLGARIDRCLTSCLSLGLGVKFGIYNNDIYARQSIRDGAGTFATALTGGFAGDDYVHASRKDDVAGLGELDLGINYLVNNNWRVNVGYRAIGVAGVALAPTQIPRNFTDYNDVRRIKSNSNLLLHGAYFGLEWAF